MYRPLIVAVPVLAALAWIAAQGDAPSPPAEAAPAVSSGDPVQDCLRAAAEPTDISNQPAHEARMTRWHDACTRAIVLAPDNPRVQFATGNIISIRGDKTAALPLLRKAMDAGEAGAAFDIFEMHKSFSRGDVSRVPYVTRAEGARALRRAAELGHPQATLMLTALLIRGGIVKRDNAEAIRWAEAAQTRPTEYSTPADRQAMLGRILLASDKPEDRSRGVGLLQANITRYGAKTALGNFYRKTDPVRARALFEEALRPDPGGATPPLADMLIKGEGGPKDEKRGVSLLVNGPTDVPIVSLARGRLYAEGKYVARDMEKAIKLIRHDAGWSHESRMELFGLLAANPAIKIEYASGLVYDAVEAVELGEPDATISLIRIKLSDHVQLGDKAGGCALAIKAAEAGDAEAATLAASCPK